MRFSTLNCDLIHVEVEVCACVCVCIRACARVTFNRAPDKRMHFLGNVNLQAKQNCIEGY